MKPSWALAAALVLGACTSKPPALGVDPGAPEGEELHVLNWAEYFADGTIPGFEKECRCSVIYDNFDSGDALRAKLDHVPSGYDVVFPSDEVVPQLVAEGKLERLDRAKLPGLANVSSSFLAMPYDRENAFTVPYMWGLTGIAYNRRAVPEAPDSWAAVLDPKAGSRLALLDDPREVFAAALRLDGQGDLGGAGPERIEQARKRIAAVRPRAWNSQPQAMLIQGDVDLAQMFSGDAAQVASEGIDLGFVVPREGGTIWFDNMAIAKGSRRIGLAHRFIDYLLRPDVAAANTSFKKYASPNRAARSLIRREILANPMIYPSEADVARCQVLGDLRPEQRKRIMDAWAQIKMD